MRGTNQHTAGWTDEQNAILLRDYEEHGSLVVSLQTGRTRSAVVERARLYGLKFRRNGYNSRDCYRVKS